MDQDYHAIILSSASEYAFRPDVITPRIENIGI